MKSFWVEVAVEAPDGTAIKLAALKLAAEARAMTPIRHHRRIARVAARRSAEQGLTLIELLLSLAILAILTGFLAGGLSMARQAFDADRASEIGSETECGDPDRRCPGRVGAAGPV